ncbi:MAG: hypothetical protein AUJ52_04355 [Elusimicrobia bacterium CG1_02_63_36]|nr:MAG: hypothetical protein AUJ52_04355 [Elusimicrobia bacterium CG1_02_63_36]PIP82274.1 MAG: hypothetical protein COR54_15780 [Elusimicrobia bacterium CG22_combo_CG10-13_8_21_14_all_63_91]PJA15309.1 MAG: hypothetical protein COX66_10310 [Elusimicrobia bacterium CG_4_10_14_0_2_um_filter_63_34]PJB27007.1 MAG: hypothetical protein CO113_00890 [Elusimicrobia bacterium CG_4_9_14_3_um_filter_62_55]
MERTRLKFTIEAGEVLILGDEGGLEHLAEICRRVIGKKDPSGHWHLQPEMNNLVEGSMGAIIQFTDDDQDFREEA